MWIRRVQRMIQKNRNEFRGILLREYPAFVLRDDAHILQDIPVFVFHHVTVSGLEPMLQFLAENRYTTLTADEYTERRVRGERGQEREVLLTFDDAHKSLYTVAFPTLRRFGLKAVAYIVPGRTPDCAAGDRSASWQQSVCSWQDIREMHASGTVDVQSHSMYHHSISVSERVVDFLRPDMQLSFLASDLAPLERAYGTPLYAWGPRFSATPGFRENPAVVTACVQYVAGQGGAAYFRMPGWRRRLQTVWAEARRCHAHMGFETAAEQHQAILQDFAEAQQAIAGRLEGKQVRHFCYPWFQGSALSAQLSAEAGYLTNAWGSLIPPFVGGNPIPLPIARLSPVYLWRLPGTGRKSLHTILQGRLRELLGSKTSGERA